MMQATSFPQNPAMQGMPPGPMMGGPGPGHHMQPGMQMHPGVSGPNGPVSQPGPMMGMQPGVGPNAHALSHLQPQHAHMFQQQQHPGMINQAALMQQHRNAQQQAALMRQQQQQQQMLAQQNGMQMGFPNQMGNMGPQQMAALQQNMGQPFVQLPPHLRQQMQQQQAMQQQQQQQTSNPQQAAAIAHAQQQALQAQAQAHAQQAQHSQPPQMQQQQAIAMQHAQSQQSNHSQSGNQGPPATSQPPQGPLRPPSAMSHQASPARQPTPQQPQQSGPQPPQQTPAPNQPPNMPQQPTQQPQNQPQMQQRNPAMASQQAQAQAAQAANAANAARLAMMRQPPPTSGHGTLKLMLFVDQLGKFNVSRGPDVNAIGHWQGFVDKFFSDSGSFIHVICSATSERTKLFEIVYAAMPRYFYTQFNTEVENLQITLDGAAEKTSPTETKVTCERAKFIYTYKNQCQVVCQGKLTAFWAGSEKMEWLQFESQGHQQYLPRSLLESLFEEPPINPLSLTQSPRLNKSSAKQKQQQQRAAQVPQELVITQSKLPSAGITDWGLPPALQSYLEIYETMNNMTSLMAHYLDNPALPPATAMNNWCQMMSTSQGIAGQNPNQMQGGNMPPNQGMPHPPQPGMPPGARTPSGMGQPGMPPNQQFMSPAMQNALLPNGNMSSPHLMHTPSPASHPMVTQHSQSSNTASVSTSPNVNAKRRRSTAKMDGDDGGGDVNGAPKIKQSPRVGGNKRVKANN